MKIIRTPTRAEGGLTEDERQRMAEHVKLWTARAFRTKPIDPDKITSAIEGIYAAAGLKIPHVVIVPSPRIMAFAGGFSAAIWYLHDATYDATRAATDDETYDATRAATHDATRTATSAATSAVTYAATYAATSDATSAVTDAATHAATDAATDAATRAATDDATLFSEIALSIFGNREQALFGLRCAQNWSQIYQGGSNWSAYDCYLSATRDILGLKLSSHEAYAHWEQATIEGAGRIVHKEFCIVSDFPEYIKVDERNLPHCETGPSHRWRDGWELFHWHGVVIPGEWVTGNPPSAKEALTWENIEQRRVACEIIGWNNILAELNTTVIDVDGDEEIGTLLEADIPESGKERFLKVRCGTGRDFVIPVPPQMKTAIEANSWTWGLSANEYHPEVRT